MNIAMNSQWNLEANNFAMENNDYETAFESYISDDAEEDGELKELVCWFRGSVYKTAFKWISWSNFNLLQT